MGYTVSHDRKQDPQWLVDMPLCKADRKLSFYNHTAAADLAVQSTFSQPSNLTSVIQFVLEYMKPLEVIVSAASIPK